MKPSIPRTLFTHGHLQGKFQQYTLHAAGRLAQNYVSEIAHFCINVWGSHCLSLSTCFHPLPEGEGRGEGISRTHYQNMALPYSISEVPKYLPESGRYPRRFHGDPVSPVYFRAVNQYRNVFTRVISTGPVGSQPWSAVRIRMSSSRSRESAPADGGRTVPDPPHNLRRPTVAPGRVEVNEVGEDDGVIPASFISLMVASNSASRPVALLSW